MSVRIKISYEDPEELKAVLKALEPLGITCKVTETRKGRFWRAYARLEGAQDVRNVAIKRNGKG